MGHADSDSPRASHGSESAGLMATISNINYEEAEANE